MQEVISKFESEEQKNECQEIIKNLIHEYKALDLQDNISKGILANLEDQLSLALHKHKYFKKWGVHQYR